MRGRVGEGWTPLEKIRLLACEKRENQDKQLQKK